MLIEGTITSIFISPECMLEYEVYSMNGTILLIFVDEFFAWGHSRYLDLVDHCNGDREEDVFALIDLSCRFYINFYIFSLDVIDFYHGGIHD
jgi:hypothetical protein